jgi:Putative zinc-binding metallo-peptidase
VTPTAAATAEKVPPTAQAPPAPQAPAAFHERPQPDPRDRAQPALRPERQALLRARIKDLQLQLAGTHLERLIHQLWDELGAKGIDLRPQCYLSDEWGCPSGIPVIGIPFYLANPALQSIEGELGGSVESEREILMYLRHEAGHCFNYAYRLYETPPWRALFGDYHQPYKEDFKPKPFSRAYVTHIAGWYAQKHPDEDFAETFAVWLTPGLDWAHRYRNWGAALKKLQYVDQTAQELGHRPPLVSMDTHDIDADQMEETVGDYYRLRDLAERVDLEIGEKLDTELFQLFEPPGSAATSAAQTLRDQRQTLIQAAAQYSGVNRAVVRSVVDHLTDRTEQLKLTAAPDRASGYVANLGSLITALAMNELYTGRLFDTE